MHVSVVVLHHALAKSLLAGSVPKLQLDVFVFDVDGLFPEVDADGGLSSVGKFSHAEAESQASLSDVGIAEDDDFEDSPLFRRLASGGGFFHHRTVHRRRHRL